MALADTAGDGPLPSQRYHDRTSTFPEAAPASDASRGSPALDQPVPIIALRLAQGSHTRGPVPDLRGILVQSLLVGHDSPAALRG